MKVIDIGICIDNIDPKGIGRIRYKPKGLYQSEIEKSIDYEQWDENDPFILTPFLPLHINVVPQIQQSVKIIKYDTDKEIINAEYIAGPYTSSHDLQNQTFLQQHRDTTYGGNIVKDIKDIREKNGKFKNKLSNGSLVKNGDVGFKGNYGSDIIFTENGLQLRGGHLISKNNGDKKTNLEYPIMSKKMGRFSLKKFSKTMEIKEEYEDQTTIPVQRLTYIIEYETDSPTRPTTASIYVYKIVDDYGNQFNTNVFDTNTDITKTDVRQKLKLINSGNTLTDPTVKFNVNMSNQMAYVNLRDFLYNFYENKIDLTKYSYNNDNTLNDLVYPFYFRPSHNFRKFNTDITFTTNHITLRGKTGFGLIFSHNNIDPLPIIKKVKVNKLKQNNSSSEQTFGMMSADKIYITSTSPNGSNNIKTINFDSLDNYELTQEDYVKNIEPNTYALVRGDILLKFLRVTSSVIFTHVHNINKPPVKNGHKEMEELEKLLTTLEDELLNKSLRIN